LAWSFRTRRREEVDQQCNKNFAARSHKLQSRWEFFWSGELRCDDRWGHRGADANRDPESTRCPAASVCVFSSVW